MNQYKPAINLCCLLLFAFGIINMLMPARQTGPHEFRWMAEISVAGHMLVFFLGAYLIYAYIPRFSAKPFYFQVLSVITAAIIIGSAIEGLQAAIPGRSPSFTDISANTAGAMAFLSAKSIPRMRTYFLLPLVTIILTIFLLTPFFKSLADEMIAYKQFPLLAGFETPFEAHRFIRGTGRFGISDEHAYSGSRSLRVLFGTQIYSGIALEYMPGNWQGYSDLKLAVYNPAERQVTLHLRIHDKDHAKAKRMIYADRFNRTFSLVPKHWNEISIPLTHIENAPKNRKLNMKEIDSIGFFVAREPEAVTLYIDDIRLE